MTSDRTRGFCVLDQIVTITVRTFTAAERRRRGSIVIATRRGDFNYVELIAPTRRARFVCFFVSVLFASYAKGFWTIFIILVEKNNFASAWNEICMKKNAERVFIAFSK